MHILLAAFVVSLIVINALVLIFNFELEQLTQTTTVLATLGGSLIAILGIKEWKQQLRGKTDYEIARRYLKAAYRVRDAIEYTVRNPFISIREQEDAEKEYEDDKGREAAEKKNANDRAVYGRRWKKLQDAVSELNVELIEAEVSWGKEAKDAYKEMNACITDLFVELDKYLNYETYRLMFDRDMIYGGRGNDKFTKRLTSAVEKIEIYLSPHLK
jgi:hypothetical protein